MIAAVILTLLPELLRRPGDMVGVWPHVLGIAVLGAVMLAIGRKKAAGSGRVGFLSRVGKFLLILGAVLLGPSGWPGWACTTTSSCLEYRMVLYALALILMMIFCGPRACWAVREIWDKSLWRALIATGPARGGEEGVSAATATAPATKMAALEVRGVCKSFGGLKAVTDFNLAIPAGGLHGLIGPNGAGKTTVFNLLTGVYKPDKGEVILAGKPVTGLRPFRIAEAGMARTFQNIRLFGELSVIENVKVAGHVRVTHGMAGASSLRTPKAVWRRSGRSPSER